MRQPKLLGQDAAGCSPTGRGSRIVASSQVSSPVFSVSKPWPRRKPRSKLTLWPTTGAPPTKRMIWLATWSKRGLPATSRSVMPVSCVIS